MSSITASTGQLALIVVAIAGLVAGAAWLLKRRRHDVWSEFARRRGLTFLAPPEGPAVTGRSDGRAVAVTTTGSSSDRGVGGVAVVRMSVGLNNVPPGMTAEGVPGLIGDLAVLAEDRIEFEEEEDFSRDVLVKAEDEPAARTWWSRDRQQAFLQLVTQAPSDHVAIRNATLVAEFREVVSDRNHLDRLLDLLLTAAPRLDGGEG